ncbi:hypothetical protein HDU97_006769 [Phlyctochytrium planicorne]|nr:hypothetical protein HDU97_006769 [Phlyctochytrium planicorne]
MFVSRILAVAALIAGASAARLTVRSDGPAEKLVDNAFLYEVPVGVNAREHLSAYLASKNITPEQWYVRTEINTSLFSGISIAFNFKVSEDDDIVTSVPQALNVFRVHEVDAPRPAVSLAEADGAGKFEPENIHALTGVNQVRKELGLTGKGIKVAVIDSGIDYNHEALGGGFGPGYKVAFGYDLVGDNYSSTNRNPVPDPDPLDSCSEESHGTHVSGIIGADATNLAKPEWLTQIPFTGVAPDVTLGSYRVFSCSGNTGNDIITAAIYMAGDSGADIINMSLGGSPTFNDSPDSIAVNKVTESRNIMIISANSNEGASGAFTGSSPGNAALGLGIASFDNSDSVAPFFLFNGNDFRYNPGSLNGDWNTDLPYEIVANDINALDNNVQNDGLGKINPAVKGKAALVRWSGLGGSNARCTAVANAGAVACILYADSDAVPNIAGSAKVPSLATTKEAGAALVSALKSGKRSYINVTKNLKAFPLPTAATVSDFSSVGLDQELSIKPDLGAIGGEVFSTISKFAQGATKRKTPYATYGGTSMATPYTAGVAALLLQALGRDRPTFAEFKRILQNTANPAKKFKTDLIDSVAFQGAGLINAYQAITSKTAVFPSNLALNDTQYTQQHYKLTVTNKNTVPVTYGVKHLPALQVTPFNLGDDATLTNADNKYTADYATVKFSKNNDRVDTLEFTLKAGESKSFNVHFQPPSNAVASQFPIYSGYVVVTVDGDKVASVPYAGLVGRWRDAPVLVRKSAKFDDLLQKTLKPALGALGIPVAPNATFSTGVYSIFDGFAKQLGPNQVFNATQDPPLLILPVAGTTTRRFQADVLYKGSDWSALKAVGVTRWTPLTIYSRSIALNPVAGPQPLTIGRRTIAERIPKTRDGYQQGQTVVRPSLYLFDGAVVANLSSDAASALALPAGRYQIRIAGLKHFGRTNAPVGGTDYDTVLSNEFDLVY